MAAAQDCKRAVDIEIPVGEVEREYSRVARDYQKHARIPGFRPGKAPLSLVRRRFQENIREEVLKALLPAHLRAAWQRENLEPVSTPDVENLEFQEGQPIRFRASFEIIPGFELADYRSLKFEPARVEEPGDDDVHKALADLQKRHAVREPIPADDPAALAAGQLAQVELHRQIEGEPELKPVADRVFEIGSEETRPEFSAALNGARVGDERELDVNYPADAASQQLAGKRVHYKLRVKERFREVVPELNDDFALSIGFDSLDTLRARVRDELSQQRAHAAEREVKDKIIERLLNEHSFAIPESLIEKQINTRLERGLQSLAAQGIDASKVNLDWSRIRGAERQSSERDVRISILLDRIAEKESLEAPPDEVEAEVRSIARRLGRSTEEIRPRLSQNGTLERIANQIRNERTLDFLYQTITGAVPLRHRPQAETPPAEAESKTGTEAQA